jgi:alcohol dehydrogenase (NADP+)
VNNPGYQHDMDWFIPVLKRDATLCRVGVGKLTNSKRLRPNDHGTDKFFAGSNTGGIRETQEMLDFCAIQKIKPRFTKIPMDGINDAWSKVVANQARYRSVMDMEMRG